MIMAGEYIDLTLGATLGISTMAAAALGNTLHSLYKQHKLQGVH